MKSKKVITLLSAVLIASSSISLTAIANNPAPVYAKSRLRRAYIPRRFRGNWYWHGHKMTLNANTVNGFGVGRNHNKSYLGSWKIAGRRTRHANIINGRGNSLNMMINNGAIGHFRLTRRHGRRALRFKIGPDTAYYYKSKSFSRHHN